MQASVVSLGDRYQNIYMTIALFNMCLTGEDWSAPCALWSIPAGFHPMPATDIIIHNIL